MSRRYYHNRLLVARPRLLRKLSAAQFDEAEAAGQAEVPQAPEAQAAGASEDFSLDLALLFEVFELL